ncbi:MAG: hypothetical protein Q4G62_05425 [Pseudomonadota bacterium]|nr:hypothetical protein [Pseudomonadota bacterium]
MTAQVSSHPPSNQQVAAGDLLQRTLDLLGKLDSIGELDRAALQQAYGLEFANPAPGRYQANGEIGMGWWYGIQWMADIQGAPRLDFTFDTAPATKPRPAMTPVCAFGFDDFRLGLEQAGFKGAPYHAEHGRMVSHVYQRGKLRVEVYPAGETERADSTGNLRYCVKSILVR